MMAWTLEVNGRLLPVTVRRSRRRSVALHLSPGPTLELRAPQRYPESELRAFLEARRGWVARHLPDLPRPVPTPRYRDGDRHAFLGRDRRLVLTAPGRHRVLLGEDAITMTVARPDREDRVAAALTAWYRRQARRIFGERLAHWRERRLAAWGLPPVSLRLRRMRRRWGSCSSDRVITLNTRLVEYDPALIDLVVVHELCHLLEFNHSRRFYMLMDAALPDWRARARNLDRGGLHLDAD
jgi:predicted metal-dependent hydrolase